MPPDEEVMPNRRRNPIIPPEQEAASPRALQRRQQSQAMSGMFRVNSNVFRIYGDGMKDDVMVRCEAYVFRQPYDEREIEDQRSRLDTTAEQDFYDISRQMFRILDWKIVQ
jgi:hypothetical protein